MSVFGKYHGMFDVFQLCLDGSISAFFFGDLFFGKYVDGKLICDFRRLFVSPQIYFDDGTRGFLY